MSDTIEPRTFPYRPSGGWRNEDIWIGSAGPAHDDIPDGATTETKDRLKMIGISALDSLLEAFKYKINVETFPRRAPGETLNAGAAPEVPNVPTIRISAPGAKVSTAGWIAIGGLGLLLLVGIAKEGGIRA